MFRLTILGLVLAGATGCHKYKVVRCDQPTAVLPDCPPVVAGPPAPPVVVAAPGPPQVEVKQPAEIHAKAPPHKITINMPPPQVANAPGPQMGVTGPQATGCPPPGCAPPGPGCAPPGYAPVPQPGFAPVGFAPIAPGYAPVGFAPAGTTETVTRPRTRIALGFDRVRISLPVLKLFALPTEHETTTRTTSPALAPVGFAPVAAAPAMAPVGFAPAAPQMFAPAPQMQAAAPQMQAPAPQVFAPAPPQMFAPAPQMYAPPPPIQYTHQGYIQPTMNGVICVPGPGACPPTGCEGPGGVPTPALLEHLNKVEGKLDAMEQQHRMWRASQGTPPPQPGSPTPLPGPTPLPPDR